jgi:DNA ligase-1
MQTIIKNPTLFCRDKKGSTRIWFMEQCDGQYRTVSGMQDGELVTSEWTVCYGKNMGRSNETTAEQQAAKEIEAKYKKQLKTGYHKDIADIDNQTYIEPSLAKQYNDYADDIDFATGEWGLQCKFNGLRCIATKKGLFTRKGESFVSVPHVHENLKAFFEKHPDAVLDGELFNNELRQSLNEIVRLARKTVNVTAIDLQRSAQLIKFYIYDGYGFGQELGQDAPYIARKTFIDENVIPHHDCTRHVKTDVIHSKDHLDDLYQNYVADDQEGGIIRNLKTGYINGRSKNLLKIKPVDDDEFKIVDIQEGSGNWAGKAKIITVQMPNGTIFNSSFKGSMEQAVECLAQAERWIGKIVTIQYNGFTGLRTPNYAQFDYSNCVKG